MTNLKSMRMFFLEMKPAVFYRLKGVNLAFLTSRYLRALTDKQLQ